VTAVRNVSGIANRMRRAGWHYLFGQELAVATSTHWTTQWHPSEVIAALQWRQIRDLVAHARAGSAFYRQRLAHSEVGPDPTPDDFRRIPPLTRRDVVSAWATIRVGAAPAAMIRRHSGGSSGLRVEIPLDRPTYCWYIAGTWRGLRWWGADFADRGTILLGSGSGGLRSAAVRAKDWVMNWLRVPVDRRFDQRAPEVLDRLAAFGPAFIYGYPSAVHRLARVARDRGWRPRGQLRVIALTGEPVYAFQRRGIEEIFQCPVAEEYGNGELGCMAFQCPEGSLHVTAENVFLETVGIEPPVEDAGGLILATQLRNRLFPLIRYDTGDVGGLQPGLCRCGRGLPTVRVLGRQRDRLVSSQGATPARARVEALLSSLPESLQGRVQVAHTKPGRIVLRVELGSDSRGDLARATAAGTAVFGPDWHVGTVEVERFARLPSGKFPYFLRLKAQG
jgi:phenylacetate-CoA ligase